LKMLDPGPTHFNRAQPGLQHEIGHGHIARALQLGFARIRLERREQRLRILHREMPPRVLPTAGPALDKIGRIHEARMERHEPLQKLTDRREVAVLRPQIRKPLIQRRAIGLETHAIETTHARVVLFSLPVPLLQPGNEEPTSLEISPRGRGGRLLRHELPREFVEIDTEPNEG
jgi:hypothetical protein